MNFIEYILVSLAMVLGPMLGFLGAVKLADEVWGSKGFAKRFSAEFKAFNISPSFSRAYVGATILSDWMYGEKIISRRALFVSIFVTIFWLAILAAVSLVIYGKKSWFFNEVFSGFVARQFWVFLLVGMAIDFISTCMTRVLLLCAVSHNSLVKTLIIVVDLLASVVLFYVLLLLSKYIFLGQDFMSLTDALNAWLSGVFNLQIGFVFLNDAQLIPVGDGQFNIVNGNTELVYAFPEGMIFISSLLTSFWIFAHMLAHLAYVVARKINPFFRAMVDEAAVDARPFLSFALIICTMTFIPIWLSLLVLHFFFSR